MVTTSHARTATLQVTPIITVSNDQPCGTRTDKLLPGRDHVCVSGVSLYILLSRKPCLAQKFMLTLTQASSLGVYPWRVSLSKSRVSLYAQATGTDIS